MGFDLKAWWREVRQVPWASVYVKHPLTCGALEVVVVCGACGFKAWVLTRQGDCAQFAFLNQGFEVAIDRGHAQPWDVLLCSIQHFLRKQRTLCVSDGALNGVALPSIAFHGLMIMQFHYDACCACL
jgi:hypothetical protein